MPYANLEKQKEAQKEHYARNKELFAERNRITKQRLKDILHEAKDNPCMDCGESYPYYVMDFDHVRGEKRYDVSKITRITASEKTLLEEIAKCDLVCSNCHRERTFSRML